MTYLAVYLHLLHSRHFFDAKVVTGAIKNSGKKHVKY